VTLASHKSVLRAWDSEIVAAYIERDQGIQKVAATPCELTLQRAHARDLILVVADVAVRSARLLGESLAALDSTGMRDEALGIAVSRYLAVLPSASGRDGDSRVAERILTGLIERREPRTRASLRISVALPISAREGLDAEIDRVLSGIDLTDLNGWNGDLASDVRSSVVEAIAGEWMHLRADAFGIAMGRDRRTHDQARLRRQRRGSNAC
jgi:hypothetical protein